MRMPWTPKNRSFFSLLLGLVLGGQTLAFSLQAADFDLSLNYGQSQDFWKTVNQVQEQRGSIVGINEVLRDKYGKPDLVFSSLQALHSYKQDYFESVPLSKIYFGTRAEASAGGEVSNPISPKIIAYGSTLGIASFGFRSDPAKQGFRLSLGSFAGLGPEKQLYAEGAEFLEAIPVRNGLLFVAGLDLEAFHQEEYEGDFFVSTYGRFRPSYFHSTTKAPRTKPHWDNSFFTWRFRLQNEWLKEIESSLADHVRVGIITSLGQNPIPNLELPFAWDYQQRLPLLPNFTSMSGLGGMIRLISEEASPSLAAYAGLFAKRLGGGLDLQYKSAVLTAASWGIENSLSPSRESTRLWTLSLGLAL